jgi:hypothetical protein
MLRGQSVLVWIWGDSRVAANQAAYEVAHRLNPKYLWVDIGSPDEKVHPEDPSRSGAVPREMLYGTVPPSELAPENASANLAMWSVVKKDEPTEVLHPLMDFLRLPQLIQEIVGNAPREGTPAVWVAANADRLMSFYPDDPASSQPILDVWRRERLSTVVTLLDHPRKDRFLYDYVFQIQAPRTGSWRDAVITCERAPPGQGYSIGKPVPAFRLK